MSEKEKLELEIRRVLGNLRHLYWNLVNGHAPVTQEGARSIADGILSPQIKKLEKLADSLIERKVDFPS